MIAKILFFVVCGISVTFAYYLEGKQVDPAWLQEQNYFSIFVSVPKSNTPCGDLGTHDLGCIYCVNDACGNIDKNSDLYVHFETDPKTCYNKFVAITHPNHNVKCPSWVSNQAMITSS